MKTLLFCVAIVALWLMVFAAFLYWVLSCVPALVAATMILTPVLTIVIVTAVGLRVLGTGRFLVPSIGLHLLAIAFFVLSVPNLLGAIDRVRQRETMDEMKQIAASIEEYRAEHGSYPRWSRSPISKLSLAPPEEIPILDSWCTEYEVESGPEGYVIVSYGKDCKAQVPPGDEYQPGTTTDFDDDIVLRNGKFFAYPEGMQP